MRAFAFQRAVDSAISSTLAVLYPKKESRERQVNTSKNVLQHVRVNCRDVLAQWLDLGKLQILIEPRKRPLLRTPSITALLKRRIVKLAANRKLIVQDLLLPFGRVDAIAKSLDQYVDILSEEFSGTKV